MRRYNVRRKTSFGDGQRGNQSDHENRRLIRIYFSSWSTIFMSSWWKTLAGCLLVLIVLVSCMTLIRPAVEAEVPVDPDYCTDHHKGDEAGCLADHAHDCVWCTAKAVKPACYNAEIAKQLPHSIFKCSNGNELSETVLVLE